MTDRSPTRLVIAGLALVAVAVCGLIIGGLLLLNVRTDTTSATIVSPAPATNSNASDAGPKTGLLIVHVLPDSPASGAGLAWGQFVVAVDEAPVAETGAFTSAIASAGPGGVVRLTIWQSGRERTLPITLADAPPLLGVQVVAPGGLDLSTPAPSAELEESTPAHPSTWPVITAVAPNSPAAQAGLEVGDVVTAVDSEVVLTVDELINAIQAQAPGMAVTLTIRRGPATISRTITLAPHPDDAERPYLGITLGS